MGEFTQAQLDEINPTLKTLQDALKWAPDKVSRYKCQKTLLELIHTAVS